MWGSTKKLKAGGAVTVSSDDEKIDIVQVFASLYKKCAKSWGWSPNMIDETYLDTLMEFMFYKESDDPNTRVIKGKVYKRSEKAPSWL